MRTESGYLTWDFTTVKQLIRTRMQPFLLRKYSFSGINYLRQTLHVAYGKGLENLQFLINRPYVDAYVLIYVSVYLWGTCL